jgi:hypothetical protein
MKRTNKSNKILGLVAALFLTGCGSNSGGNSVTGGGGGGDPLPAIEGKWTINSTSTEGHINSVLLVNLSNQGSGNFYAPQVVLCYNNPALTCYGSFAGNGSLSIQGTVTAQGDVSMSITSSPQDATGCTATYTGTLAVGSISGTYTGCGDAGTMTATLDPSVTGTYTGQLTSGANPGLLPFSISASITEAGDHSLTGSASITNSPCFTSLSFGPPSIAVGASVYLQDATHGITVITPLENPTVPSGINVVYTVEPTQYCGADYGSGTLTKQ